MEAIYLKKPRYVVDDESKVVWVDIGKVGEYTLHPGMSIFWSATSETHFIEEKNLLVANVFDAVRNFKAFAELGEYVSIKSKHGDDGNTYGEVVGMRYDGTALQSGLLFISQSTRERYNDGLLRQYSPSIVRNYLHVHSGAVLNFAIEEVSFTSDAHQRNLRDPFETNAGLTLSKEGSKMENVEPQQVEMQEEAIEGVEEVDGGGDAVMETLNTITAQLAMILEAVGAASASKDEAETGAEQPAGPVAEMQGEIASLRKRLAKSEDDQIRQVVAAAGITDDVEHFVSLARTNKKLFDKTVELCKCQEVAQTNQQAPIGLPIGFMETGSKDLDPVKLAKQAYTDGVTAGTLTPFLKQRHALAFSNAVRAELKKLQATEG